MSALSGESHYLESPRIRSHLSEVLGTKFNDNYIVLEEKKRTFIISQVDCHAIISLWKQKDSGQHKKFKV